MHFNNFQQKNNIIIEGHRGVGNLGEHNKLLSFQKAIDLNLDYIELDVFSTLDNKIVVLHGDKQQILINGKKKFVRDCLVEEILEDGIDIDSGETLFDIPLLEQVLNLCKNKIKINIEIKGQEYRTMYLVLKMVQEYQMLDQIYISTFKHIQLKNYLEAKKNLGISSIKIPFAFIIGRFHKRPELEFIIKTLEENQSSLENEIIQINFNNKAILNSQFKEYLSRAKNQFKIRLGSYFSFSDPESHLIYEILVEFGVTNIITNNPQIALSFQQETQIQPKI